MVTKAPQPMLYSLKQLFKSHTACERYLHWLISTLSAVRSRDKYFVSVHVSQATAVDAPTHGCFGGQRCGTPTRSERSFLIDRPKHTEGLAHVLTTVTCIKKDDYKAMKGADRTWADMYGTAGTNKLNRWLNHFLFSDWRWVFRVNLLLLFLSY